MEWTQSGEWRDGEKGWIEGGRVRTWEEEEEVIRDWRQVLLHFK